MAKKPSTYYQYEDDPRASGILIIEAKDDQLRITENLETGWSKPVWMPEQEFRAHTHGDRVSNVGTLSDEQFDRVLERAKA